MKKYTAEKRKSKKYAATPFTLDVASEMYRAFISQCLRAASASIPGNERDHVFAATYIAGYVAMRVSTEIAFAAKFSEEDLAHLAGIADHVARTQISDEITEIMN